MTKKRTTKKAAKAKKAAKPKSRKKSPKLDAKTDDLFAEVFTYQLNYTDKDGKTVKLNEPMSVSTTPANDIPDTGSLREALELRARGMAGHRMEIELTKEQADLLMNDRQQHFVPPPPTLPLEDYNENEPIFMSNTEVAGNEMKAVLATAFGILLFVVGVSMMAYLILG